MVMMKILPFFFLFAVSSAAEIAKCTISGYPNEEECISRVDGSEHCVWCEMHRIDEDVIASGHRFGFCVAEHQAESMEHNIPIIQCHRYDSDAADNQVKVHSYDKVDDAVPSDDQAPPDDDQAPVTDDQAPPDDDQAPVTDDQAPPDDDQAPASDDQAPPDDDQTPTTDDQAPPDDDQAPATDDQAPPDDDQAPATDDQAPPDDDKVAPSDDAVPDDFWTCLLEKNSKLCSAANCTWCDTKAGFGVCMTGAAAESASHSDWFKCKTAEESESVPFMKVASSTNFLRAYNKISAPSKDPYDSSCVLAFIKDQTEAGCISATDENGQPCEWCNIAGMSNVCLTAEQASTGASLGVSCDDEKVLDPYDTACALAFLQDQTKEGCLATEDEDGNACEFCSMQGSFDICLTEEQAGFAQQFGITCDSDSRFTAKDPYDTSCVLAYLQDQSKEGCLAAADSDGNACEFCSMQGAFDICLTEEQAGLAQQFGITCDETNDSNVNLPPDFFSCLENYQEDACRASPCTWCNTEVGMSFCLSTAAAEATKECKLFDCEFFSGFNNDVSNIQVA